MTGGDARSSRPGTRSADRQAAGCAAIRALGAGVAVAGDGGSLIDADPWFLQLHGIRAGDSGRCPDLTGLRWPEALARLGSSLPSADRAILDTAWRALAEAARTGTTRDVVRLEGGRTLLIAGSPLDDGHVVLVGTEIGTAEIGAGVGPARRQSRLAHDVNNCLGGMLAHLYLAMADTETGHPARRWIEAVNRSALDLRARLQQAPGPEGGR